MATPLLHSFRGSELWCPCLQRKPVSHWPIPPGQICSFRRSFLNLEWIHKDQWEDGAARLEGGLAGWAAGISLLVRRWGVET